MQVGQTTSTTYLDTVEMANTTYNYRVSAINDKGGGPHSDPVNATTHELFDMESVTYDTDSTQVTITWNADEPFNINRTVTELGMEGFVGDFAIANWSCTLLSPPWACTDSGLEPNTRYTYSLYVHYDTGDGAHLQNVDIVTSPP